MRVTAAVEDDAGRVALELVEAVLSPDPSGERVFIPVALIAKPILGWVSAQSLGPVAGPASRVSALPGRCPMTTAAYPLPSSPSSPHSPTPNGLLWLATWPDTAS